MERMKKIAFGLVFGLVLIGGCIVSEFADPVIPVYQDCPDDARFLVYSKEKWIVPDFVSKSALAGGLTDGKTSDSVITYGEMRKKGSIWQTFTSPTGERWQETSLGQKQGGIIRAFLFPPSPRWTPDGRWNF